MKHIVKSLASLALGTLACAAAPSAFALTTEHASVCNPYGYTNQAGFFRGINGLFNYSGSSNSIVCPVVRTIAAPSTGFQVWVDGTVGGSGTGTCTLYSYDYTGVYKGSVSVTVGPGFFDKLITLPQTAVPTFSSQSVLCYLPTSSGIYDVEPVQ